MRTGIGMTTNLLFDSNGGENLNMVLDRITPRVTDAMNAEEVKEALFQMHPTKSPGPVGMSPGFYQKHWDVVGADVCDGVLSMLQSGCMLRKINYTHVTLIPKVKNPTEMSQMRPISLCNVLYKIVANVLTNRLKSIMPKIFSPT
ncbi:hypothetical protein FF1_026372 [Malus domestica]